MSAGPAPIPILASIRDCPRTPVAWLVDLWGVMHNGVETFPEAIDACRRFREGGGIVILLSNAPRPWGAVAEQLDRLGVARDCYDAIVSSGDAARLLLRERGRVNLYHLGPARDLPLYDGLGVARADAATADLIVCTGLFDDTTETAEDYAEPLRDFASRGLPMICANPDLAVERGDKVIPCAGAVAKVYESLGGSVTYAGKPYPGVYAMAFDEIRARAGRKVAEADVLAIGDGVHTDIAGAANAGVPSVFVASGVHVKPGETVDEALLVGLFADGRERPIAAMTALRW